MKTNRIHGRKITFPDIAAANLPVHDLLGLLAYSVLFDGFELSDPEGELQATLENLSENNKDLEC